MSIDKASLPYVLKSTHIMQIMDCSRPSACRLMREADAKGLFPVKWIGNSGRAPRDLFFKWLEGAE